LIEIVIARNVFFQAVGAFQFRAFRVGIFQVGIFQVGIFQVGIFQVGIFQVGAFQVDVFQVGVISTSNSRNILSDFYLAIYLKHGPWIFRKKDKHNYSANYKTIITYLGRHPINICLIG